MSLYFRENCCSGILSSTPMSINSNSIPGHPPFNRSSDILVFQLIAAWGTAWSVTLILFAGARLAVLHGWSVTPDQYYGLVLQNPYFAVQVLVSLMLGLLLGARTPTQFTAWVWALPLAILLYALIFAPVLSFELASIFDRPDLSSRLSHYLGYECRPSVHCMDQVFFTLPFYCAVAFSVGASMSRKRSGYFRVRGKVQSVTLTILGSVILFALAAELLLSWRAGLRWSFLVGVVPLSTGTFLLILARRIENHDHPASNTKTCD
jgi:hypothetical protein